MKHSGLQSSVEAPLRNRATYHIKVLVKDLEHRVDPVQLTNEKQSGGVRGMY